MPKLASFGGLGLQLGAAAAVLIAIAGLSANETRAGSNAVPAATEEARIVVPAGQLSQLQLDGAAEGREGSILNITKRMKYGQYVWNEDGIGDGAITVRVDLKGQTLSVFRGGHEIGTTVILYGATEKPTPPGTFEVLTKIKDHRSSLYDAPMPYTLRLTDDGISIHGADVRKGAATHGCVGVPETFAALLFGEVAKGDKVVIV